MMGQMKRKRNENDQLVASQEEFSFNRHFS